MNFDEYFGFLKAILMLLQKLTSISLTLIVVAFVILTGNIIFFSNMIEAFPFADNYGYIVTLPIWLFSLLAILLLLINTRYTTKPILIIVLIITAIVSYFTNSYGTIFDENMIANSVETNLAEATDLFSLSLLLYVAVFGFLPSYWVYKVSIIPHRFLREVYRRIKFLLGLVVIFIAITLMFFKSYTEFSKEHRYLRLYTNPTYPLYATGQYIHSLFEGQNTPFKIVGKDAKINRHSNNKKLVIMVAGETARADRFSVNGYQKNTNPLLSKEAIVSFSQMHSCGTDTATSLPCMFSLLGRTDYSYAQGKNMSNVLDVLNYAGVEVLWRDNNSSSKTVADRVTYQDFKSSDINPICDIECRDIGMLDGLQKYITQHSNQDILIVLHMMGSHGPAYYKRYPQEFEEFTPTCKVNQLGKCSDQQINNAYDNTIVYADYFLSKTIEFLKQNQTHQSALFYMSDHGESLGENGLYLHGMPYFVAPKEQTHVASLAWFDAEFLRGIDRKKLKQKATQPLNHDGLFHTLLGLFDVDSQVYNAKLDYIPK